MAMNNSNVNSLQGSCIKAIARNFDSFLPSLNRNENVTLKKCLQRNFSKALSCTDDGGPWRKSHALFLINRHLKTLHLNNFSMADIDDIIRILKSQGKGILKVTLKKPKTGKKYSKSKLVQLARSLPRSLKALIFHAVKCSSKVLKIVSRKCHNIQKLVLFDCSMVTDKGLEALFSNSHQFINSKLEILDLRGTSITVAGIVSVLNNCPNLKKLQHASVGNALVYIYRHLVNDDSHFRKYNLEMLSIDATQIEAAHVLCPNVEWLILENISTPKQIDFCMNFEKLDYIIFYFVKPVSLTTFFKTRGSILQEIVISGNVFIPIGSLIYFCPRLHSLTLGDVKYEIGEIPSFIPSRFSLQNLKHSLIVINNPDIKIQCLGNLFAGAPNLETLFIHFDPGYSYAFLRTITAHGFPSLIDLNLPSIGADKKCLRKFIDVAPNLKCIGINSYTDISQNECEELELLKSGLHIIPYDQCSHSP